MRIVREKLFENPDGITASNAEEMIGSKTARWNDYNTYPFGYYNNKFYMGNERQNHSQLSDYYPELKQEGLDKYEREKGGTKFVPKNLTRLAFKYAGRVWTDKKLLSFWEYPSVKVLKQFLKDINKDRTERIGIPALDFNSSEWTIEIKDTRGKEEIIKLADYKGSNDQSKESQAKAHVDSPMHKKKKKVPKGVGSNSQKYQDKQKEKRYMAAESYVRERLFESYTSDRLNKRIGNKKIFVNKEMIVIVDDKKIVGVLTTVGDKVAKVAAEKGEGTLLYYAALALRNGIRPNDTDVTDDASKVWEYKLKSFPNKRLKDYKHDKDFLNYKYFPPSKEFVSVFKERAQELSDKVEQLGWKYVDKSMTGIYGKAG